VINDRLASLVNLLTYSDTERALLGSRLRFGVIATKIGFSLKICAFFSGYVAKNLLRNLWIKVGDCGNWTNFQKSCKKLARWQDKAAALQAYRISLVFLLR